MINFILNETDISTDLPSGMTVLDFVRCRKNLKGTKIGCREGDCGACTILVGELIDGEMKYRSMTSCLMPLVNANGKHIVTVEGINPVDNSLTPVQQAMVDESGTQCGFCTVGFVMSLTGFCLENSKNINSVATNSVEETSALSRAISAIDGNICRCTGYKSIERACGKISELSSVSVEENIGSNIKNKVVPEYFASIIERLKNLETKDLSLKSSNLFSFVAGGTDVYVQRPEAMAAENSDALLYANELRGVSERDGYIEIGASATVTDLLESDLMNSIFPDLYKHLKLVSSTPIRNMATLAGNFVNASPIGDMTAWFLSLNAEIDLSTNKDANTTRKMNLRDLYLGYKQLAKNENELITKIRFKKPLADFRFNFEKVCKRTYLDIATVNTAISMTVRSLPGETWLPPALSESPKSASDLKDEKTSDTANIDHTIIEAHVSAGGVAPTPLYLSKTSKFLCGKIVNEETIAAANEIMQTEISPISDVRGTEKYKRLLLRQLFRAHFFESFGI